MSHSPAKGTWNKCPFCHVHVNQLEWGFYKQCPHCHHYLRLTAQQRINQVVDKNSFKQLELNMTTVNQLKVPEYDDKLAKAKDKSGLTEAMVIGTAQIKSQRVMLGVMDTNFMMGTLNTTVGEIIKQLYFEAAEHKLPVVLFIASGGARMQEGIYALLQMNTILNAKRNFDQSKQVSINVLTDPTMGGVSASFAFEGDFVIAEKYTQIGFAGRRVIETISTEKLPIEFQDADHLKQHGLLDDVIERSEIADYIGRILKLHQEE